jgi:prepilin-type processing-associated H-X9-DG protein
MMILPEMEQSTEYNSFNFFLGEGNGAATWAWQTAWYTVINTFLCPSDGAQSGGFTSYGYSGTYTVTSPPPRPGTTTAGWNPVGQICVPVTNYFMSFGDNYAVLPLGCPNPWELAPPFTPGVPRRGYDGFWGTQNVINFTGVDGIGIMRGFSDYRTGQVAQVSSVTDGMSNTILLGESLPSQDGNNEMWGFTAAACGTTIPLNYWTGQPNPPCGGYGTCNFSCRFSYAARGFKSAHPGGANFAFADGHVQFVKSSVNPVTYNALGSRQGGEVISSDTY